MCGIFTYIQAFVKLPSQGVVDKSALIVYYLTRYMSVHNSHKDQEKPPKRVYFAAVIMVFFTSLSAADSIGFVPCQMDGTCIEPVKVLRLADLPELGPITPEQESTSVLVEKTLPTRIKISAIDLDLPVQNPQTRDMTALDNLLLNGPARHMDSAQLGGNGTVIIFAHSSRLVVRNQMFRAFNKVPSLRAGDSIEVKGEDGRTYLYSVTSVTKVDTEDTSNLLSSDGKKLVLITCDNFTGKSARFVLKADFIGVI